MKKILCALIPLFLLACGPSAIRYNDALIAAQLDISADLNRIFTKNATYENIHDNRLILVKNAEKGLEISRNLQDFKGNSDYQKSAIQYYSFVANYFSTTLAIDSLLYYYASKDGINHLSDERFNQMQANFRHFQTLETELLNQQKKFAKEFNLKL